MNPALLTAAISSLGVAVAAIVAAIGDTNLATPIRTAFAAAAPLIVIVLTYAIHKTEQAKITGGAAVATAKVTPAPAGAMPSTADLAAAAPMLAQLLGNHTEPGTTAPLPPAPTNAG